MREARTANTSASSDTYNNQCNNPATENKRQVAISADDNDNDKCVVSLFAACVSPRIGRLHTTGTVIGTPLPFIRNCPVL